ncbi:MAG: rubrerythrin family protein [Planctomycetia bacterium]|nr:rubrerythrin family protein [Planctomycetia bacterium]
MSTQENLAAAFAGESQANRKYLAFAKKADQDGFPNVARLFRAAAEAETLHAHTHLKNMGGIQDTLANLEAAVAGETYECTEMYPGFIAEAEKEGATATAALRGFRLANAAEAVHAKLYQAALEAVKKGVDLSEAKVYLCPVCGDIEFGTAPERCPICGVPAGSFIEVA